MDQYLGPLLGVTLVGFVLTVLFKPRGVPVNQMYLNFGKFSIVGRVIYATFGLSFIILMAMVFIGMGLQRAA